MTEPKQIQETAYTHANGYMVEITIKKNISDEADHKEESDARFKAHETAVWLKDMFLAKMGCVE